MKTMSLTSRTVVLVVASIQLLSGTPPGAEIRVMTSGAFAAATLGSVPSSSAPPKTKSLLRPHPWESDRTSSRIGFDVANPLTL